MDQSARNIKINGSGEILRSKIREKTKRVLDLVIRAEAEYHPYPETHFREHLCPMQLRITYLTYQLTNELVEWHEIRGDYNWVYNEIDKYIDRINLDESFRQRELRRRDKKI